MAQKAKSFRPLADRMTAFGQLANAVIKACHSLVLRCNIISGSKEK